MNRLEIQGGLNIFKGRFKQAVAKLTNNKVRCLEGEEDELVGRIQKRTGETLRALEELRRRCPSLPDKPARTRRF